jgi:hypothetical protein
MLPLVVTSLALGNVMRSHHLSDSPDAGSTKTVEYHVVSLQEKTGGYERFDILRAALDFVHLTAFATLEMVMMGLRGSLIAGRLTGQLNLHEPPFFNESFEGTIDRSNP